MLPSPLRCQLWGEVIIQGMEPGGVGGRRTPATLRSEAPILREKLGRNKIELAGVMSGQKEESQQGGNQENT